MSVATATQHWTETDWAPHVHDAVIEGRRLRYVDHGEGPPLVLIHGLGGCWQWWLECLPRLAERHRVIGVDLPGFGHSDALPDDAGEMTDHAEAVRALMERLDLEPATVGGHSMGGLVTLALAEHHPERVARVLLVNAGGVPMTERRLAVVVQVIGSAIMPLSNAGTRHALIHRPRLRMALLIGHGPRTRPLSGALASEIVPLMAAPAFTDAVEAAARAVSETAPENISQPALLVWGARDPIVTVQNARDMQRRLPDARLELIDGVSHSPMIEAPDELVDHILGWAA